MGISRAALCSPQMYLSPFFPLTPQPPARRSRRWWCHHGFGSKRFIPAAKALSFPCDHTFLHQPESAHASTDRRPEACGYQGLLRDAGQSRPDEGGPRLRARRDLFETTDKKLYVGNQNSCGLLNAADGYAGNALRL